MICLHKILFVGSLAARAPVAFGGGDGAEAETAGSSPASAGCFFFLIGSLRGGMRKCVLMTPKMC